MQLSIRASLLMIAVQIMNGCGLHTGTKSVDAAATQPMQTKMNVMQYVMKFGQGKDVPTNVLGITTSPDVKCVMGDGSLHLTAPQYEVEIWLVRGAKTVDDAAGRAGQQIVDEFKDFKPEHITDLTIAGSPAKQLIGTGHEADDGDPGDADVIVFNAGDHIFIACNHGETLTAAGQQALLALVQTAQAP